MTEKRFGCLGVVDEAGRLVGIITDGDLRRAMGPDLLTRLVGDVMTSAPRTIGPDALAAEALHAMNARDDRSPRCSWSIPRPPARHPAHPRPAAGGPRMSVSPLPVRPPAAAGPAGTLLAAAAARVRAAARPAAGLPAAACVITLTKWLLPASRARCCSRSIALWPEIDRVTRSGPHRLPAHRRRRSAARPSPTRVTTASTSTAAPTPSPRRPPSRSARSGSTSPSRRPT